MKFAKFSCKSMQQSLRVHKAAATACIGILLLFLWPVMSFLLRYYVYVAVQFVLWPLHCYSCPILYLYGILNRARIWAKPLTHLFMMLMMVLRAGKSIMKTYRAAQALKHPINNKSESVQKPLCYNLNWYMSMWSGKYWWPRTILVRTYIYIYTYCHLFENRYFIKINI